MTMTAAAVSSILGIDLPNSVVVRYPTEKALYEYRMVDGEVEYRNPITRHWRKSLAYLIIKSAVEEGYPERLSTSHKVLYEVCVQQGWL